MTAVPLVMTPTGIRAAAEPPAERLVLVVDDSRMQRRILSALLTRAGYRVAEAGTGREALQICRENMPDIIVSDWMMPGMTGLKLCEAIRDLDRQRYVYFILLTSRSEKTDVTEGLAAGADDFLTKPVNGEELRARIAAGERILRMERELTEKNRLVSSTLSELQRLYDSINRDLVEARKLQQSLIRERQRNFGNSDVSLLLRPAGHIGGDLVGFFPIGASRIGLFALDVSGHGITSAMMTARLAGYLSGVSPEQNIALIPASAGGYAARRPAEVAAALNRIVIDDMQTESYFTLAYADVDLTSGEARIVQAGHPHPILLRASGQTELLGNGGLPIGMFDHAEYQDFSTRLDPGDRLLLISDGFTEAASPDGSLLGDSGFAGLIRATRHQTGQAFLEALFWEASTFAADEFNDDVSAALLDFRGPNPTGP